MGGLAVPAAAVPQYTRVPGPGCVFISQPYADTFVMPCLQSRHACWLHYRVLR
jgi:hypothetical protein